MCPFTYKIVTVIMMFYVSISELNTGGNSFAWAENGYCISIFSFLILNFLKGKHKLNFELKKGGF